MTKWLNEGHKKESTRKEGRCSSSRKISSDWLDTLLENNRTNNNNNNLTIPLTLKTITAATQLKQSNCKLTRAATLPGKKRNIIRARIYIIYMDENPMK